MKEAVTKVIDTLTQEDFPGASRSCWNGTTSALQPEEITSKGSRVLCVYYQYKCPYKKSLETYLMILVHTHIYIYCHVVSHWEDRIMMTTILLFELTVASHQRMTVKAW